MKSRNQQVDVYENTKLDGDTFIYIISLRIAFLPLWYKDSFILKSYYPSRFSRQFGFCHTIPICSNAKLAGLLRDLLLYSNLQTLVI